MKLAALFCNHAVLQRDLPLPVWGWAAPGEKITVTLAGNSAAAVTDADGAWRVSLPALPAGGPHTMTVAGSETITLTDLLVGDVWVCSGQSNMQMTVLGTENDEQEIAAADYPAIRLFTVPNVPAMAPKADIVAEWKVCSPKTVSGFSAVGYFFGRELTTTLNVPVGLINTSWGGTVAEAWTSRGMLAAHPETRDFLSVLDGIDPDTEKLLKEFEEIMQDWDAANRRVNPPDAGFPQGFADPATDTADWAIMDLPAYWQARGLQLNGVVWFRKEIDVPAAWAGKDLTLSVGAVDKADTTYFNNVKVGGVTLEDREDSFNVRRIYTVPGTLVKAGRNVVAVRAFSHVWAGGVVGKRDEFYLCPVGQDAAAIALAGDWQYKVEVSFGDYQKPPAAPLGPGNPNTPTVLFNGMIYPLIPYGIKGAIWYQGESNVGRAEQYKTLFPAMITDWRAGWAQGDFPFYYVQLANFQGGTDAGFDSGWAELREAQAAALDLPNSGEAVIIDIGESTDIHPRNKKDVGKRLAFNALAKDFGQAVEYAGPTYRSAVAEGGALRVYFNHADGGLVSKSSPLPSFVIAGPDRQFYPANAVIDGETVVVSSPQVATPIAVRYGWADDPVCTLYNQAGLPASPFRTDAWTREMAGVK